MSGSGGEIHVGSVGVGIFVSSIIFLVVVYIAARLIYRVIIEAVDKSETKKARSHASSSTDNGLSDDRSPGAQQYSRQFYDIKPQSLPGAKDAYKMVNYSYARREKLMTLHEREFYRKLFCAVGRQYLIFPQLNLDKLLNHQIKHQYYDAAFRSIRAFSVDYVLCDTEFRILCAIELDDSTHNQASRQKRDRAVNQVLYDAGLPLLRIPLSGNISEDGLRTLVNGSVLR